MAEVGELQIGDKVMLITPYDERNTKLFDWTLDILYEVARIGPASDITPEERRIAIYDPISGDIDAWVDISNLRKVDTEVTEPVTKDDEPESNFADMWATREELQAIAEKYGLTGDTEPEPEEDWASLFANKNVQFINDRDSSTGGDDYNYRVNDLLELMYVNNLSDEENRKIETDDPEIIQNQYQFPKIKSVDPVTGRYRYDYYMDYDTDFKYVVGDDATILGINSDLLNVEKSVNLDQWYSGRRDSSEVVTPNSLYKRYNKYYNKYKMPNLNDQLSKSFAHVFIVRPDCNIYADGYFGTDLDPKLAGNLDIISEFYYAKKHSPELLQQLTQAQSGIQDEFMMFLSNKASSFELSDEYVNSDTYGKSVTGYQVAYGKHNVESRTANKISLTFNDDRNLHVYQQHKLWTDYIAYVYRGKHSPVDKYVFSKILDYATVIYYILCAEDMETVIFWSKYWGCFPIDSPSSIFSWSEEDAGGIKIPKVRVQYQYSWKEDFNPLALIEFNMHSRDIPLTYISNFNPTSLGPGTTWAGAPFIETFTDPSSLAAPYTFKLRFRPA